MGIFTTILNEAKDPLLAIANYKDPVRRVNAIRKNLGQLQSHHIDALLYDSDTDVRAALAGYSEEPDYNEIVAYSTDRNVGERSASYIHPITKERYYGGSPKPLYKQVKVYSNLQPHHIQALLSDPSTYVRWWAAQHPAAQEPNINSQLIDDPDDDIAAGAFKKLNTITDEHVDKLISRFGPSSESSAQISTGFRQTPYQHALANSSITASQFERITDSLNPTQLHLALDDKNLSPDAPNYSLALSKLVKAGLPSPKQRYTLDPTVHHISLMPSADHLQQYLSHTKLTDDDFKDAAHAQEWHGFLLDRLSKHPHTTPHIFKLGIKLRPSSAEVEIPHNDSGTAQVYGRAMARAIGRGLI